MSILFSHRQASYPTHADFRCCPSALNERGVAQVMNDRGVNISSCSHELIESGVVESGVIERGKVSGI